MKFFTIFSMSTFSELHKGNSGRLSSEPISCKIWYCCKKIGLTELIKNLV